MIIKKSIVELTAAEYKACCALNLGNNGKMLTLLKHARNGEIQQAYAYCIWENNTLLSWVLVYNLCHTNFVHAYTRVSARRKGLGARILAQAHSDYPMLVCEPHDEKSARFFKHGKVKGTLRV